MTINKVLCIEDTQEKYMDVYSYLRNRQGVSEVDWAEDAENAIKYVEESIRKGEAYDLIVSDMTFDFFGKDDLEAGEKTLKMIRNKGCDTPVIFCSSQNCDIPGAFGNIFYNPDRDWEYEADKLFKKLKKQGLEIVLKIFLDLSLTPMLYYISG